MSARNYLWTTEEKANILAKFKELEKNGIRVMEACREIAKDYPHRNDKAVHSLINRLIKKERMPLDNIEANSNRVIKTTATDFDPAILIQQFSSLIKFIDTEYINKLKSENAELKGKLRLMSEEYKELEELVAVWTKQGAVSRVTTLNDFSQRLKYVVSKFGTVLRVLEG